MAAEGRGRRLLFVPRTRALADFDFLVIVDDHPIRPRLLRASADRTRSAEPPREL